MKKIFLTFLMLLFSFLPFSFSNIFVDASSDETIIDYFPDSLQLLDLENWFEYYGDVPGGSPYLRSFWLKSWDYKFILDPEKEYTLVLNKSIFTSNPFQYESDDSFLIGQFVVQSKSENEYFYFYVLSPTNSNLINIDQKNYQLIDFFDIEEFLSKNDAFENPDVIVNELKELMILHEGLPKSSYTSEDFKYKIGIGNKQPVFDGDTYFVTNVMNPFTLEQILSHIVAYDEEDGYIDPIVIEDNFSANRFMVGSYTIKLQATDSSGNSSELVLTVLVVDVDSPVIFGPDEIEVSIAKKLTVEEIKSKFPVADNYDVELSLSIIENNYQNSWNKIGRYKVVLKAIDSSGNETIREVYIKVVDDVVPEITGPTNIVKNNNEVLTISDIKALFTAVDNVDGDITNSLVIVEDGYTGNGHKVGEYKIVLAVTDTSGNEARHEVIIKVLDKIPPVFYIDNFLINVQSGVVLTKQQIVDLLIATGQLEANGITYVNFLLNEYEGNENIAGIYNVKLSTVSTDGSEKAFDLQVKVLEVEDDVNPIIVETKNFFEKVWKHILENWYWYLLGLIILLLVLKRRSYRRW